MIKILFLGDIIGKIGRKAVVKVLPKLKKELKPDIVIANVENLAHGIGFTQSTLAEIVEAGVDVCTSGNHAWGKSQADEILDHRDLLVIRPINYVEKKSGQGIKRFMSGKHQITLVNVLGQVFMKDKVDSPFLALEKTLKKVKDNGIVIVDFHAEATSEKYAFAHYFDGRVSLILGTHTHVPTADPRILSAGTGYVTDVGMIGYYDSVIGADKGQVLNLFLKKGKSSKKHDLPDIGKCQFNAIYAEVDTKTKQTTKIKRFDKIVNIT